MASSLAPRALLLALLGLLPAAAHGEDTPLIGAGGRFCRDWMKDRIEKRDTALLIDGLVHQWIEGFVSGYNAAILEQEGKPLDLQPPGFSLQDHKDWLTDYCITHPDSYIFQAAFQLAHEIVRRNR